MAGWMQLAGSVLGSIYANKQAKKAQNSANQNADFAYGESQLRDYQGLFGGYNAESGEYLNEDMQGRMDGYFNRADATGAQIGNYSPEEYAQNMYDMDLQMLNPELEQQSLNNEARLLAQGRLGSTGGAGQTQGLMQAQNMTRLGLRRDSYNKSQFQLDAMRRRQQEDMSMGLGFGGLTQQYAANSYNQAQLRGNNAWRSANMKSGAAANRAGANTSAMTGLMGSFGKMNFGGSNLQNAQAVRNGTGFSQYQDAARGGQYFPK